MFGLNLPTRTDLHDITNVISRVLIFLCKENISESNLKIKLENDIFALVIGKPINIDTNRNMMISQIQIMNDDSSLSSKITKQKKYKHCRPSIGQRYKNYETKPIPKLSTQPISSSLSFQKYPED